MLSINVSELIWTIVNFFLLYFLLKRFREEAAAILSEAQKADAEQSRQSFAEAKEAAARALEDANASLRAEQERERATLASDTPELAAMLAERLLDGGK